MARTSTEAAPRERIGFNADWRFLRGDAPGAPGLLDYEKLRPWLLFASAELLSDGVKKPLRPEGEPATGIAFVKPEFDDSAWRKLTLPHDFGIEGPFAQELPGETGKLPWHGACWYRKRFALELGDVGRQIALDIDGAMSFSAVWLNGRFVGGWPFGYTSFRLDLTPYLDFAGENVLAIRLDNPPNSSRWYPGGGLYRNVWLSKTAKVRVAHWGTFASTPRVTARSALVSVEVTLENLSEADVEVAVSTAIFELGRDEKPRGKAVAKAPKATLKLTPGAQALRTQCAEIVKPKLWTLAKPRRYVAVTSVHAGETLVDRVETAFGVRTIRFDADDGFSLNGKRVELQGVCLHHDLGALGSAVSERALERQIEILQAMGANAIRTSHNPPAPELLDLCDRMGMLVMDEAFDCWRRGKKWPAGVNERDPNATFFDYARVFDDWHERDLRALIRRDRNHPSVVIYSIGNELMEQWYPSGWKLAPRLAGIVREEDRTRPITAGLNDTDAPYNGFQTALDVAGYNYKPNEYIALHESNPALPIVATETSSCISSRGEYFFPVSDDKSHGQVDFQVSSYDLSATSWAFPPDVEFRGLDQAPFVAGEFVWTGFDYLGEPTPYNSDTTNLLNFTDPAEREKMARELERLGRIVVPSRSSYFGIIDLAGFPKDRFYLYQARWRPELRMAHILPHWNWPERIGQVTPVHVYSAGDEGELFLNGKSLGVRKRKRHEYRLRWDDVVYAPGKLKVVTYKRGKKWASATLSTTGPAYQLVLSADRKKLTADARDLSFVTVAVADKRGLTVPRARQSLRFSIEGPAEIIAVDNGDPTSFEPFQATQRKAFNGLALVIVRTLSGKAGKITLRAESDGLQPGKVVLHAEF